MVVVVVMVVIVVMVVMVVVTVRSAGGRDGVAVVLDTHREREGERERFASESLPLALGH